MFGLICRNLTLQAKHQEIKSAFFPASSTFRPSVCLLTFNISLSWVVLTLALALTRRLWVSLGGRDMPVCFGFDSCIIYRLHQLSRHAVSGMQQDKPPILEMFWMHAVSTFNKHLSRQCREVTTWKWNLSAWSVHHCCPTEFSTEWISL